MGGCVYEVDCLVFYWISKDLKKGIWWFDIKIDKMIISVVVM